MGELDTNTQTFIVSAFKEFYRDDRSELMEKFRKFLSNGELERLELYKKKKVSAITKRKRKMNKQQVAILLELAHRRGMEENQKQKEQSINDAEFKENLKKVLLEVQHLLHIAE